MDYDRDFPAEFMARRENWSEGVSLYFRQRFSNAAALVAAPLVLQEHEKGSLAVPFLMIGIQEAQQLMDELWQCGLRPTEGKGSAGALASTERHLEDMRALVFKKAAA